MQRNLMKSPELRVVAGASQTTEAVTPDAPDHSYPLLSPKHGRRGSGEPILCRITASSERSSGTFSKPWAIIVGRSTHQRGSRYKCRSRPLWRFSGRSGSWTATYNFVINRWPFRLVAMIEINQDLWTLPLCHSLSILNIALRRIAIDSVKITPNCWQRLSIKSDGRSRDHRAHPSPPHLNLRWHSCEDSGGATRRGEALKLRDCASEVVT
jgi:hypothetical protein